MDLVCNDRTYSWVEDWAHTPDTQSSRTNGRTHGVVVSETGRIIVFHQADPAVLVFTADGTLESAWGDRFGGAHGLTLVKEGDTEYLWLTDQTSAEVVKTTLDGTIVQQLSMPPIPAYDAGKYVPTWVAVDEERTGGSGDIWVADGYGQNYVHRFDKSGTYVSSINGEEGTAGAFKCPHGIFIDTRRAEHELYIADRGNKQVQVYDLAGRFRRAFGSDILTSPCGFAVHGDELLIPELFARLTILDGDDQLVCHVGDNEQTVSIPGWPNHPHALIEPGKFNSPHGMAADPSGNLYVVEWIVGGRIIKLERHPLDV